VRLRERESRGRAGEGGGGVGQRGAQVKKAPAAEAPLPQIDKEKIRAHVKYLSSDEFEGRGTGQRGGDTAADYIGKQFAYGLKPAGDNGSALAFSRRIRRQSGASIQLVWVARRNRVSGPR